MWDAEDGCNLSSEYIMSLTTGEENKILDPGLYTEHIMHDQNNDPFSSLPVSTQLRIGKIGRNDKCPCGSGKKYKKCCLDIV